MHSPVDPTQTRLLEEVVEAAGLALEIARLRVELRRQLDEVEESRARIVSAGYEERRRIERDLQTAPSNDSSLSVWPFAMPSTS